MGQETQSYSASSLDESTAGRDPLLLFHRWFDEARAAGLILPEAMTLCTANKAGRPSGRQVLLKEADEQGFVFYTNYQSQKAQELESNPQASLVFFWAQLERQVRVEGLVSRVSAAESDEYFQTRPRDSQIGALASPQSEVIPGRDALQRRFDELAAQFGDRRIDRPEHWGGYRVRPDRIEFWKGRPGRLHDRLLYERQADGTWTIKRLAP
jgi:pyridoxamine 5'-phosphate oxidase